MNEQRERERRARIFTKLLEAKYALEALEGLFALDADRNWAAGEVDHILAKKAELQERLK